MPKINTHPSLNPKIKRHVAHYYFLKEENPNAYVEFWHYPHFNTTLNFFKNAQIVLEDNTRYVLPGLQKNFVGVYSKNTKGAKKAIIKGAYDIIGITFNPLGINHFIPLSFSIQNQEQILDNLSLSFRPYLKKIFDSNSIEEKVRLLDKLLKNNHLNLHLTLLNEAIDKIITCKGDIHLNELSTYLKTHRRTISRHFKQYLGYSFRDFKAVVKFRAALDQSIQKNSKIKLSNVAYEANYYDQSDFIKHFKLKTNETPKQVLKTITPVTNQLYWKVL